MQLRGAKIAFSESNPIVLGEVSISALNADNLAILLGGMLVGVDSVRELIAREAGA